VKRTPLEALSTTKRSAGLVFSAGAQAHSFRSSGLTVRSYSVGAGISPSHVTLPFTVPSSPARKRPLETQSTSAASETRIFLLSMARSPFQAMPFLAQHALRGDSLKE